MISIDADAIKKTSGGNTQNSTRTTKTKTATVENSMAEQEQQIEQQFQERERTVSCCWRLVGLGKFVVGLRSVLCKCVN